MHHLKVENYVLFGRLAENLNWGGSLSDSSDGPVPRGKGEARKYRSFCKTKPQVAGTSKDYC